ncbi:MAG: hypothetical protein Tsb0019_13090 [Roseibium sp.]
MRLFPVFGLLLTLSTGAFATPKITGVTVYDPDHLLAFAYQHIRLQDGTVYSNRLAQSIQLIYREDGYFLTEVEVVRPGDGASDTYVVHEGHIETITIEGVDERLYRQIRNYVQHLTAVRPLRLATFERAIMLARDLAGIHLTTEIDYPAGLAGARLRILASSIRQSGSLQVDNPPREFGETVSGFLSQEFYSTLVAGDLLRLEIGATAFDTLSSFADDGHSLYGAATYRAPVGRNGAYIEGYVGNALGRRNASGSLVTTDHNGANGILALGYPILRNSHEYAYALMELRYADSNSEGGGLKYRSAVDTAALALLYGNAHSRGGATEIGINLALGMRAGPEPVHIDDGDDTFWHLRAGLGHVEPLSFLHHSLFLRTELWGQVTSSRLPAVEEFYLGDRYSMRGYRFDEAEGDLGITGKFELALPLQTGAEWINHLEPFVFLDAGAVGNLDQGAHETDSITLVSAGLGWSSTFARDYFVNGWFGVPLTDGTVTERHSPAFYLSLGRTW